MAQRGRKAQAALEVAAPTEIRPVAEPPAVLTDYEASVWQQVVATKPAEWFQKDTEQLMISYCRHASQAAVLDEEIGRLEPEWLSTDGGLDRYRKLLDMREKQTRAINTLSRAMRLTQQARYDTQKAAVADRKATAAKKPWAK